MSKYYPKLQKQAGLVGAMCGCLLINLPAIAMPRTDLQQLHTGQPESIKQSERPASAPDVQNQQSPDSSPGRQTAPIPVVQPLQAPIQAPSGMVTPVGGKVSVHLVNQIGAPVTYQVIGNTKPRSLQGNSTVMLQNLPTPVTITFQRPDRGLVKVNLQSSEPGMLNVTLTPTTNLSQDKLTVRIGKTGAIFLN